MKPGVPWSIKGIDSEAREVAKNAARRSGMTLGEWLNSMILDQADGDADLIARYAPRHRRGGARRASSAPTDLRRRMDELSAELSGFSNRLHAASASRHIPELAPQPSDEEALETILHRIESNERRQNLALETVQDRLEEIARRFQPPGDDKDDQRLDALEGALKSVLDHIESSESRTQSALQEMRQRLGDMASRAEAAQKQGIDANAPMIAAIEGRIADMASGLEAHQHEARQSMERYVDTRLNDIRQQIEAMNASTSSLVEEARNAARAETGRLECKLQPVIDQAQAAGADMAHMRGEIEGLNTRLGEIGQQAASQDDVRALQQAIAQLSSQFAQTSSHAPLEDMQARLAQLTARLDQAGDGALGAQVNALQQRIEALDAQLRQVLAQGGDGSAVATLNEHIAALGERLRATEDRLGHLATIEQSIAQLFQALEQSREESRQIAESAAQRLAGGTAAAPPSAELKALEDGLEALKATTQASDQRTQETLGAVHETLEQIITKLVELENAPSACDQPSAPAEHAAATAAAVDPASGQSSADETAAQPAPAQTDISTVTNQANDDAGTSDELATLDSLLSTLNGDDTPPISHQADQPGGDVADLDAPGDGDQDWRTVIGAPDGDEDAAPLAEELPSFDIKEIEGQLGLNPVPAETDDSDGAKPPEAAALEEKAVGEEPARDQDFIAAARRAAQLSAQDEPDNDKPSALARLTALRRKRAPGGKATAGEEATSKGFSLPFLKKKATQAVNESNDDSDAAGDKGEPTSAAGGSRRRLILAAIVLLAAASAYTFGDFGGNATPPQPVQPPSQQTGAVTPAPGSQAPATGKSDVETVKSSALTTPSQTPSATARAPATALAASPANGDRVKADGDTLTTASLPPPAPREASAGAATTSDPMLAAQPVGASTSKQPAADTTAASEELPAAIGAPALRQAAVNGDAAAQFVIASRYLDGKLVKRDFVKSARWYEKAARQNLAPAQYRLGTLYERGRGVAKNLASARAWYEKAARQGNIKSMHNLAVILANNAAGKANFVAAAKWFESAGEYGLRDSQYNLAVLYERGLGVEQNSAKAYYWFGLAAGQGDVDAGAKMATLKNFLTSERRAALDKQIAAWRAKRPDRAGNFVAIANPAWQVLPGKVKTAGAVKPLTPTGLTGPALIRTAQSLLKSLGYDVGAVDGVMGSRTANAIRLFQLQTGMEVNGTVSPALVERLRARSG